MNKLGGLLIRGEHYDQQCSNARWLMMMGMIHNILGIMVAHWLGKLRSPTIHRP